MSERLGTELPSLARRGIRDGERLQPTPMGTVIPLRKGKEVVNVQRWDIKCGG